MDSQKIKQLTECRHEYVERYLHQLFNKNDYQLITPLMKVLFTYGAYSLEGEEIKPCTELSEEMNNQLHELIEKHQEDMVQMNKEFDKDTLLAYILFGQNYRDRSGIDGTPSSINKLVLSILGIKENDQVLDLCSGKANFLLQAYIENNEAHYTGIEVNQTNAEISKIRGAFIEGDITIIQSDALAQEGHHQYDKVFSNYPFGMRNKLNEDKVQSLHQQTGIDVKILQRPINDWVFNLLALDHLSDEGKAVVIMPPRTMISTLSQEYIEYFVDHGYIETIIALPAGVFGYTTIQTYLAVFSKENKVINMVDATELGKKTRRMVELDDEAIEQIIALIAKDSEYSKEVTVEEVKSRNYDLMPIKYFDILPEFEDGKTIGEISTNLKRGAQLKASELDELKIEDITPYRYLILSDLEAGYIGEEKHYLTTIPSELDKYCITSEAIVISKIGKPYFKSAYVKAQPGEKILVTGNMYIIEFDEETVNPAYIAAFLVSEIGVESIKSVSGGNVTLPIIPIKSLKEMIIPVPDKMTQDMIAMNYLTTVNEMQMLKKMYEDKKEALTKVYQ